MSKKILVVGAVASGASAAARIRRIDESAEIIVFEKGPHPSFSNCSLPNFLSREIPTSDTLLLQTPESFKIKYNIEVRVLNEVVKIYPEEKKVSVKNLITDNIYDESYDELILAMGAKAILPNIEGINSENVFVLKNVFDVEKIDNFINSTNAQNIVVVGGGFIGLEVMENLRFTKRNISLVQSGDQVLNTIDYDMAQFIHKEIIDFGVNLVLNDIVIKIEKDSVLLESGKKLRADAVIMAIGVEPDTEILREIGIDIGETKGVKVDKNYKTNFENIYAVGDLIETHNFQTLKKQRLALAGPAQRQARAVADYIYGKNHLNKGVVGSSIIRLFRQNIAHTGLSEKMCQKEKIEYRTAFLMANDRVSIMPGASPIYFKLIFSYPSGKVLGAQAIGIGNVDKRMDVIATLIQLNGTVEDLRELELCYAPSYSTAKDVVNIAALIAQNILTGDSKVVGFSDVRQLVENNALIIDVREPMEFEMGHIAGAKNIPLSIFRRYIHRIPKDVNIYLYCRSGQRSYNALRILMSNGYTNVYNIQGSFNAICHYEYFNDIDKNRKPIVTAYNFG